MKLQRTGVALLLAVGLLSFPFRSHAEEEGSMSGQHAHEGQGHHTTDSMQKHTGAAERLQEGSGTAPQAAAAQDSHGKRVPQHERADKGSH